MIQFKSKFCDFKIRAPDNANERMEFYQDFKSVKALVDAVQANINNITPEASNGSTSNLSSDSKTSNRRR
tara:strand:- start:80 stop:289 length:210 start_codon:yes stop_codon:yes gene_type:complete